MGTNEQSDDAGRFKVEVRRGAFRQRSQGQPLPVPELSADERIACLQRFQFFSGISRDELARLAAHAVLRVFRAGEHLWYQGDPSVQVAFLRAGFVKLSKLGMSHEPTTYALFGPGDSVGILAPWSGMRYPTDAIALNDGLEAFCIESETIIQISADSLDCTVAIRNELAHFTAAFLTKIDIIAAGAVAERLARLMLYLVDRYAVDRNDTHARVPFPITRDELGKIVGARHETVVRVLAEWKQGGWMDTRSDGYHIHRLDKLQALLDQSCV